MTMRLGANLEEVKPDGRTWPFADLVVQRGPYGTFDKPYDASAPLGPDGEPKGDFGFYVVEGSDDDPVPVPAGDYALSFDGQAAQVVASGTVLNLQRDAATGRSTAVVRMGAGSLNFWVKFGGVTQPVRNVSLMLPGHVRGTDVYNRDCVALLRNFAAVRFMDFTRTNGNAQVHWADRTPAAGRQSVATGAAWEHAIGLANAAGVDPWVNVPHMADDDYVAQLAALFAARLNADRRAYVAYSNEVWNNQFPQFGWNVQQAGAEQRAGRYDYNYGGANDNNPVYWGFRRTARRAAEIGAAFRKAFAAAGRNPDAVRPVLEHQIMWYDQLTDQLAYVAKKVGVPQGQFYGAAVGSYLGPDVAVARDPNVTTAALVAGIRANLPGIDRENQRVLRVCQQYGLRNLAYELGTDIFQENVAVRAKVAAQADPAMGGVVASLLAEGDKGLDLACYYLLAGAYSRDGYWGLTDRFPVAGSPSTPKLDAALAFARSHNVPPEPPVPPPAPARTVTSASVSLKDGRATFRADYSDGTSETIAR